uniref:tRNA methyltransferase subunit 11-2 n=1 Tax=Molossus molossus TaxID=27622 RepID=A0A7J8EWH8_MOLMO|nr:tRNA methyltransferase subunit 11-2 [Molossus molossus]
MKLLTHNLLSSHVRGVGPRGFPLRLEATEVRIIPVEFNPDFVARMIPKVEWAALLEAADNLRLIEVPKGPIQGYEEDETFLRKMHHVLLEVRTGLALASMASGHPGGCQCSAVPHFPAGGGAGGHPAVPRVWTCVPHHPRDPQYAAE